jgi:tRNA-modifying protein YgfZ
MECARLTRYGLLSVTGDDAREFLHAQLTNDVLNLPAERAALAGWCSAKGRLLASFLVIPAPQGFLLQLARDLAAPVAKRLAMYVLRAKVKVVDESDAWTQLGLWGEDLPVRDVAWDGEVATVRVAERRFLRLSRNGDDVKVTAAEDDWILQEIHAGRPFISAATQDQFVPQMVNLEMLGGVDFQKGCYPGQEIVARMHYRGTLKQRMYLASIASGEHPQPGEKLYSPDFGEQACGTVVNAAPSPEGGHDLLAVIQISAAERGNLHWKAPDGPALELLELPYGVTR